ncbi:putative transcription repressor PLATZ family [Medicago truncatula]|uniref:Putative transcription repressor PLATZ family n=1 Tax=Medicago truncatula TaxID=3880 RepID=A0A396JB43_MEDTR|nr:putative transcription repressor PLATZ family [Medicago truncatula]
MMCVPWLVNLLAITSFFATCEAHPNKSRNERNKFCLDCNENPLCESCIESRHKDHLVIQIRRSSYNEVVKTTEIYKHVDLLGIQTYVINSSSVVYLNKRAHAQSKRFDLEKIGHSRDSFCKRCDIYLMDSTYFCSLACKVNLWSQSHFFLYNISMILGLDFVQKNFT